MYSDPPVAPSSYGPALCFALGHKNQYGCNAPGSFCSHFGMLGLDCLMFPDGFPSSMRSPTYLFALPQTVATQGTRAYELLCTYNKLSPPDCLQTCVVHRNYYKLSVCLSVCLSVYMSVCLSVCMSVFVSIFLVCKVLSSNWPLILSSFISSRHLHLRTYVRTTSAVGGQRLTLTQQTLLRTLVQASFPKISHAAVI